MHAVALPSPELQNGDRMSAEEFLWRWEQIPELKHAELIEGVVYLASPVSGLHGEYDDLLHCWLTRYRDLIGEDLQIRPNTTTHLGEQVFQPDLALRRVKAKRVGEKKYVESVPDLIVEISYSSRSYDLGVKLAAYRASGVPEYIAVLLEDKRVEWRTLSGTRYRLLHPTKDGLLRSTGFPGLCLDTKALFPPDRKRLLAALEPRS
jgi:Uma2 family endonuclease